MNAPVSQVSFSDRPATDPGYRGLKHLPGPDGLLNRLPWIDTIRLVTNPYELTRANHSKYGNVYRVNNFGGWHAVLLGPEANELVLLDRDRIFSSAGGWNPLLERLFPNGLMLMDFEVHRVHRKTLSVAFKSGPMASYAGLLNDGIRDRLASWRNSDPLLLYPAVKQLTLDLAATSFLGVSWGPQANRINDAFRAMVTAATALIRTPLPGTAMARGIKGRRFLSAFFAAEIEKRRGVTADDIFTQVVNARDENGQPLTTQEIIDHMNFLMMAAHDTLTSSLTSTVYFLGKHPEWQQRLREEVRALWDSTGGALPYDRSGELPLCEMAFKEALRLLPPVPSLPRQALRSFTFNGHHIPAGTRIGISPMYTHRMEDIWPEPHRFDPLRFTPELVRERHKYAWIPFGGGAHMCLGLHFAMLQAKIFLFHLLGNYRVELVRRSEQRFTFFPIPKPRGGLPVRIRPI